MNKFKKGIGIVSCLAVLQVFLPGIAFSEQRPVNGSRAGTMIISAEGLADPLADTYARDRGLLLDALRDDAKKQIIEKAVGVFVRSSTLVENYEMLHDRVLRQTQGLIKRIIKESAPWKGQDGFMHIRIKAEVYTSDIRDTLKAVSRAERVDLLKSVGNPKISVKIKINDLSAEGCGLAAVNPGIAANVLKEKIKTFGYRVGPPSRSDYLIQGSIGLKKQALMLSQSGLTMSRAVLTSWVVRCTDLHTREEVYFNNILPRSRGWENPDQAVEEIGHLVADEFNKDFFEAHLMMPSIIYAVHITGLPSYNMALLLEKEMAGLRPILNIDIRDFSLGEESLYEIEFSGGRENFSALMEKAVISPLNHKLGNQSQLQLARARGNTVHLNFISPVAPAEMEARMASLPPISLINAHPNRISGILKTNMLKKSVTQFLSAAGNPGK